MDLSSIQTSKKAFILLELDQGPGWYEFLDLDESLVPNQAFVHQITSALARQISSLVSGVILDPTYSFSLVDQVKDNVGLILRVEQWNTTGQALPPLTLLNQWGIEHVANNLAMAKCTVYYHPQEDQALIKKQMLAELYDFCRQEKVPLLLKLLIREPSDSSATSKTEAQIEAIQELRKSCDILAIELPSDPLASVTLTAELDIPWLVNLDSLPYAIAKDTLRQALESGAQGCVIGQTAWQEIKQLRKDQLQYDEQAIEAFIATECRDRFIEIQRIIEEGLQQKS